MKEGHEAPAQAPYWCLGPLWAKPWGMGKSPAEHPRPHLSSPPWVHAAIFSAHASC